jgi:GGDEF domain-containing protein
LFLLAILLLLLIGFADHTSGYEISFSLFYILPVALVAGFGGAKEVGVISILCAGTWLLVEINSPRIYTHPLIPHWNGLVMLGFFLIVGFALLRMRWAMESLENTSCTDPLTGTANMRGFHERAEREIDRCARYGTPLTLAYLDLDNFKIVNDTLGHRTGDELLIRIAAIIDGRIRENRCSGSFGGRRIRHNVFPDRSRFRGKSNGKHIEDDIGRDGVQGMARYYKRRLGDVFIAASIGGGYDRESRQADVRRQGLWKKHHKIRSLCVARPVAGGLPRAGG